jgi:hypothetical protein
MGGQLCCISSRTLDASRELLLQGGSIAKDQKIKVPAATERRNPA